MMSGFQPWRLKRICPSGAMVNSTQRFIPPLVANVTVNRAIPQCRIDASWGIFSKAVSFLCEPPTQMLNTVATARKAPRATKALSWWA